MLKDSTTASTGVSDELEEVEEELGSGTGTAVPLSPSAKPAADPDDAESAPLSGGEKLPPAALDHTASEEDDSVHGGGGGAAVPAGILSPLAPLLAVLPPILIQAFTLTFVAEWGDRSQVRAAVFTGASTASFPLHRPSAHRSLLRLPRSPR